MRFKVLSISSTVNRPPATSSDTRANLQHLDASPANSCPPRGKDPPRNLAAQQEVVILGRRRGPCQLNRARGNKRCDRANNSTAASPRQPPTRRGNRIWCGKKIWHCRYEDNSKWKIIDHTPTPMANRPDTAQWLSSHCRPLVAAAGNW